VGFVARGEFGDAMMSQREGESSAKERKLEDVVKSAGQAAVLVLVY